MNDIESIAFVLYLSTWLENDESIADIEDKLLLNLGKKWRDEWMPGRFSDHKGDCTKHPCTCMRCVMDELFANAKRIKKSMEA